MTPLRWSYPKSHMMLRELAADMGIHPYEYEVGVDQSNMAKPSLEMRRGNQKWVRDIDANDLVTAGALVRMFFDEVLEAIRGQSHHAYQEFIQHREV